MIGASFAVVGALGRALPGDVPVDPTPPEAQDWVLQELAKPPYQAAQPTPFDRVSKAISDWINSLSFGGVDGPPALGLGILIVVIVAVVIVAVLIFGLPRLNRRSAVAGALFGDDDVRDAASLRRDALAAAEGGDYTTAIVEQFRAIARDLSERVLVTTTPGTTASGFAAAASAVFDGYGVELEAAARTFDGVRYLGRTGARDDFESLVTLDRRLRASKPRLDAVPV